MRKNFSTHIKPIMLGMVALAVVTVMVLAMAPSVMAANSEVLLTGAAKPKPLPPKKIIPEDKARHDQPQPQRPTNDKVRPDPQPQKPANDKVRPETQPQKPDTKQPLPPKKPNDKVHPAPQPAPETVATNRKQPPRKPDDRHSRESRAEAELRRKAARFARTWRRSDKGEVLTINGLSWSWKTTKGKVLDYGTVTDHKDNRLVMNGRAGRYYATMRGNRLEFRTARGKRLAFK